MQMDPSGEIWIENSQILKGRKEHKVWFKYGRDESIRRVGQQSQYMACDSMYLQPSFLAMHEAEVHHDAGAYRRPQTT
jgi:hypothetical protein